MSQIRSLYRSLFRHYANFYVSKLRFAVVWLGQIHNLDTDHVYVLGLKSGSERLSVISSFQIEVLSYRTCRNISVTILVHDIGSKIQVASYQSDVVQSESNQISASDVMIYI